MLASISRFNRKPYCRANSTWRSALLTSLLLVGATGCDDASDQDTGDDPASFEGRAIDGPVAGGTVYLDRSETDYDQGTTRSRTNRDGNFSLDDVAVGGMDRVILRVHQGRDQWHGLRIPVTMSRHFEDVSPGDELDRVYITPLTSLMSHMGSDGKADFVEWLNNEHDDINSLLQSDVEGDYLDFDDNSYSDKERLLLIRTGFRAQKLAEVIAEEIHDKYELNTQKGRFVYQALAENWVRQSGPDSDGIGGFVEDVIEATDKLAAKDVGTDPRDWDWDNSDEQYRDNLKWIWKLIGSEEDGNNGFDGGLFRHVLHDDDDFTFDEDNVAARARALEAATLVLREEPDWDGDNGDGFKEIAKYLAGIDIEHDVECGDNSSEEGCFDSALNVEGFALGEDDSLRKEGADANPYEWQRGDKITDDLTEKTFEKEEDGVSVEFDGSPDEGFTATVKHKDLGDEPEEFNVEDLDGYSLSVETEVGGSSFSGNLRKTDEDKYEFEFQGVTYDFDLSED
ncbi:carboxypeptidase-like regulatory domain-containing protein [Halorhodospira halochloris]|uniref:carboxypeptidase-like regulatory domain-containing protein n=1 Tax=Halorhodospira halochloris TaxID=1052 RepID=UPI001EE963CF|nr:carboxypeptidase-like regulatory domain-containing protein [Halorhodospira halochloris]MCG5548178.1 carboxypeptidase-like regulatory domain-containing protein [Halorhodospira halochloris]